jgi:hypothetical protein
MREASPAVRQWLRALLLHGERAEITQNETPRPVEAEAPAL